MVKLNKKDYIIQKLEEQKIEDLIIIDTSKISSMSDWVIIGNGRSGKQIESAIDNLKINLKKEALSEGRISGVGNDGWIIYDLGDIIVHLFIPEVREIYKLEELLNPRAKKIKSDEIKEKMVKKIVKVKEVKSKTLKKVVKKKKVILKKGK